MNEYMFNVNPCAFSGILEMSPADKVSTAAYEQQDTKPAIDDVICHYLDGTTLKNALNFIDYVRASKMKIKWSAANVWSVRYKNKRVLDIIIREDSWRVRLAYDHMSTARVLKGQDAEYIKTMVGVMRNSMTQNLEPVSAMS